MTTGSDYLRGLEAWRRWSGVYIFPPRGRPDRRYFSDGSADAWAIQAHLGAAAAYAVLAADPGLDETRADASRETIRDTALAMFRFAAATVQGGPETCTDGRQWLRPLAVVRFLHGLNALEPWLTPGDQALARHLFTVHADLLADQDIQAGIFRNNRPESNHWNAILLLEAAHRVPDHPRRSLWLERSTAFFLNALSIPADAESDAPFAGRPLKAWHVGPNLTPDFGMNHHGYLNLGYMVIVLSQMAIAHFAMRERGRDAPPEACLHADDLWRIVRLCTFDDGRLCRIGGDTRARYCYCQDYALPMWLGMIAKFGESQCAGLEAGWAGIVGREQRHNGDGSYLSARLARLARESPFYYARLESDRAVTASMAAWWRRRFPDDLDASRPPAPRQAPARGAWADPLLGGVVCRGTRRIAAWRWRHSPGGICLPAGRSDLAEWGDRLDANLFGQVRGTGAVNNFLLRADGTADRPPAGVLHRLGTDGFVTAGETFQESLDPLGEGESPKQILRRRNACFALPDDRTVIGFQWAAALRDCFLRRLCAPGILIPNDLFNGGRRRYAFAGGVRDLPSRPGREEVIDTGSSWLSVDNCLAVIAIEGAGPLFIARPADRQIAVNHKPTLTSLYADVIGTLRRDAPFHVAEGDVVLDLGFVILAGAGAEEAAALRPRRLDHGGADGVRAVQVSDAGGGDWLAVANLSGTPAVADLEVPGSATAEDAVSGAALPLSDGRLTLPLPPLAAVLARLRSQLP